MPIRMRYLRPPAAGPDAVGSRYLPGRVPLSASRWEFRGRRSRSIKIHIIIPNGPWVTVHGDQCLGPLAVAHGG
jgi:hypothetical protein